MKKQLIAAAVAGAFALPAMAQVTISGSIQSGVMDTGAAGAKATVATRLGGGLNSINITSSEDLGGGMSAGSAFQMRFDSTGANRATSATGGTPNWHAARVFISGAFGTVNVGKIIEESNCAYDPWGCGGGAGLMANSGGTQGLIFADSMDRSISYTSPTINGFRLVYHTTLVAPAAPNQERTLTTLSYAQGPITAQYMMGEVQDNGKQNGFGASYDLGFLKANIASAVTETSAGAKTRDMMMYSATMPLRPGLTGLVGYAKDKRQASNANTRWAVGVNYALSKRTTLGADVFEQEQVGGSTGFVLRARHTF